MAVDTRDRRASVLLLAEPFGRVLPHPDGAVTQPDRQQLSLFYRGISALAANIMAVERSIGRRLQSRIFGRVNRVETEEVKQYVSVWRR
jgi:hypothetical protein